MLTVSVRIQLPDDLVQEFLQHIRDFDSKHYDHVIIEMWLHPTATDLTAEQVKDIFSKITPPFANTFEIKIGNPFDKKGRNYPIAGDA